MVVSSRQRHADLWLCMAAELLMNMLCGPDNAIVAGLQAVLSLPIRSDLSASGGNFCFLAQRKALYQITHDGA
jgi:hypothetical protein